MRTSRFLQGMLLGVGLTASASMLIDAAGVAAGAAVAVTQNGDVNGDGSVDLSDAIGILNFLFQGGPAPAPIECEEPEPQPTPPQVRFLNDLMCGTDPINATLEVCDVTAISRQTGQPWDQCQAAEAKDTCLVKISGSAPNCGSFSFCTEIAIESGKVHDFVLAFDGVSAPMALLFVKSLPTDGSCPAFPMPGTTPTRVLDGCASLGGGAALESGPWAAAGRW